MPDPGESLLGKRVKVRITEVSKFYMKSELVHWNKKSGADKQPFLKTMASNKAIQIFFLTQLFALCYFLLRFCFRL